MKTIALKCLLAFLILTSISASAQFRPSQIEIIVPEEWGGRILNKAAPLVAQALEQSSSIKIGVTHLSHKEFRSAISQEIFSDVYDSKFAMVSIDPAASKPEFLQGLTTVALLGQLDLAAFVTQWSPIEKLGDFEKNALEKPLVVGAHSAMAEFAALRTFRELGVPTNFVSMRYMSESVQQLVSGKMDVLIAPISIHRDMIEPIVVYSPETLGPVSTAKDQGVDFYASWDYVLVGPSQLNREIYDDINKHLHDLYDDRSFTDELEKLGLRGIYMAGGTYNMRPEKIHDDFCDICECSDYECKSVCSKCK